MARHKKKVTRHPERADRRWTSSLSRDTDRASLLSHAGDHHRFAVPPLPLRAFTLVLALLFSALMWMLVIYAGSRLIALFT